MIVLDASAVLEVLLAPLRDGALRSGSFIRKNPFTLPIVWIWKWLGLVEDTAFVA